MSRFVISVLLILVIYLNFSSCQNTTIVVLPTTAVKDTKKENINLKPSIGTRDIRRSALALWLLTGSSQNILNNSVYSVKENVEYEGFDGWFNNLARPESGAIERPLLRRSQAAYEDGSYEPSGRDRPNPLELSDKLLSGDSGTQSKTGKNALLVFFGQQVVEEILDAQRAACPPEYFNIEIPKDHRYRKETGHTQLPFLRTRYDMKTGHNPNNPRQQLNEITPYLDGGLVYGTSKAWANYLRTYDNGSVDPNGCLASSHGGLFPEYNTVRLPMANPPPPVHHATFVHKHQLFPVSRFFKLGNPRGNENTFLLTFGILWFRWHNFIATNIKSLHPEWSSEKIFNEARKWVIATQQHLVVNKWLNEWLGTTLDAYKGYDPSIDPQIDQFFQAAAMRFGHTLVVPGVYLRDYGRNNCSYRFHQWRQNSIRTCNSFWRPQDAILTKYNNFEYMDIDRILMGMAYQLSEREDHKIVEDLRGNVFGPLEFSRRDLMALNIQRGRDHGLPDYNTARKIFNLHEVNNTKHFTNVAENIKRMLMTLHKNRWDNIDPWVGGILETGNSPGELFQAIIKDQFRRIRDGDRFWFENKINGLFNHEEINRIKQLEIHDIIVAVTKMNINDIPKNAFNVPDDLIVSRVHPNCSHLLIKSNCNRRYCYHLPQLNASLLNENCTVSATYDYFSNSELSYILSSVFISVFIIATTVFVFWLSKIHARKLSDILKIEQAVRKTFENEMTQGIPYLVKEWTGFKNSLQSIVILLNKDKKQIQVNTQSGKLLRVIDLNGASRVLNIYIATDKLHLMLQLEHECSLVLKFDSEYLQSNFLAALELFAIETEVNRQRISVSLKPMLNQAITKADRKKQLDKFFRVVFAQAFKINHTDDEILTVDSKTAKETIYTELTINEFADALAMKPDSVFVRRIFVLIDKDKNGFVSFREFLDLLFIFAKGSGRDKAKLLFDMYDINGTGYLTEDDFGHMIKSLLETVNASVRQSDLEASINSVKQKRTLNSNRLSFEDFFELFKNDIETIGHVNIEFANVGQTAHRDNRKSYLDKAKDTIECLYQTPEELKNRIAGGSSKDTTSNIIDEEQERIITHLKRNSTPTKYRLYYYSLSRYIETNMRELFWLILFTLVLLSIFLERAYYYSVEREHRGLRRIAGYGVTITRGAASAMMFTYSSLLVTMCRNIITLLRDTFLNKFIPFNSAVQMHKYIAWWALFFSFLHVIGHMLNFYHISTQTADSLTCLFRNYFHSTHELPKFHYWFWQTMTGLTGVVLTLIIVIIYVCALPGVSRKLFWFGHMLYPVLFIFLILHGAGRLIQEPLFPYFFIGPASLFIIDTLKSASRKKTEIRVVNAEILPSAVTKLEFKRPNNFEYKSGQWVRIACVDINPSEYHPFTISSSPNEPNLSVHIRSVGPWTTAIRDLYESNLLVREQLSVSLPKLHLDGPYGDGHQDWYKYDVSVLIGGGIGVTPFASILKDIVYRANGVYKMNCRKVYFIWVTRTQRQFEWLVDIIRELEMSDVTQTVSIHLFITQFYHKFDLRTTLLYICERHFQRVSGKSLFTGLKAVTHFGRPKFTQFFGSLQTLHAHIKNFGVFSCGPPPMMGSVEKACVKLNKAYNATATFHHHYKNF